ETGDPSYYPKAEKLFDHALDRNNQDLNALVGLGTLSLARHDFAGALEWGQHAATLNPYHAPAYGAIGDAQIELGPYDHAAPPCPLTPPSPPPRTSAPTLLARSTRWNGPRRPAPLGRKPPPAPSPNSAPSPSTKPISMPPQASTTPRSSPSMATSTVLPVSPK